MHCLVEEVAERARLGAVDELSATQLRRGTADHSGSYCLADDTGQPVDRRNSEMSHARRRKTVQELAAARNARDTAYYTMRRRFQKVFCNRVYFVEEATFAKCATDGVEG